MPGRNSSRLAVRFKFHFADSPVPRQVERNKPISAPYSTISHNLSNSSDSKEQASGSTGASLVNGATAPSSGNSNNHAEKHNGHSDMAGGEGEEAEGAGQASIPQPGHFPGTYYLKEIDEKWVRHYEQLC